MSHTIKRLLLLFVPILIATTTTAVTLAAATATPAPATTILPDDWWDNSWDYRITMTIGTNGYDRLNKPVDIPLNFTDLLAQFDTSQAFNPDSIRVIEVNAAGQAIDTEVDTQFDPAPNYNANNNAQGTVVFMLDGATTSTRTYHIYFDVIGDTFTPPTVTPRITTTDNISDEDQLSIRVETSNATYYYHKPGAGFSSIVDINGNDWINYHPGGGSAGEYRGIPNLEDFHPGITLSTSTIRNQGPLKTTIHSIANDGKWEAIWAIYADYAQMALLKADDLYWFLYEGTPGGTLDTATDFVVQSDGTQTSAATSWNGDLSDEWAYFADPNWSRALFAANHTDDNITDSYWPLNGEMTVFGFGRALGPPNPLMSNPSHFTIGLMDETLHANAAPIINNAYKNLQIDLGLAQQRVGPNINTINTTASEYTATIHWQTDVTADSRVDYGLTAAYGNSVSDATLVTEHTLNLNNLRPGKTYHYQVTSEDGGGNIVRSLDLTFTTPLTLSIDVWYGHEQTFGAIGTPQQWLNILGNVTDTNDIATLVYSLNGGPSQSLVMGPDARRLLRKGDFNIELDKDGLNDGHNTLLITATNNIAAQTSELITVTYNSQNIWPLPYNTNWQDVTNPNAVAQVIDGLWLVEDSGLRTAPNQIGYDRVVGFGDMVWQDFEVTVPITIYDIDDSAYGTPESVNPGFGLVLRWLGHTNNPINCLPTSGIHCGWLPQGANPWYNFGVSEPDIGYRLVSDDINELDPLERELTFGTGYYWQVRAQTVPTGTFYGFNVWEIGEPEPTGWQMSGYDSIDELDVGSLLFVAHHVDATLGPITIAPLTLPTITITIDGNGTVLSDPDPADYQFGRPVTLTAVAAPSWGFTGWQGDINSSQNPLTLILTNSYAITATFTEIQSHTLTLNSVGNGNITADPNNPIYVTGETVTLTAVADPDWLFLGWSGDLNGNTNPAQLLITSDSVVTATFILASDLAVSDDFNSCSLNTGVWQLLDPVGDASLQINGTQALLVVPAGSEHSVWGTSPSDFSNTTPRLRQNVANSDFEVDVKFESGVDSQFQSQGLLIVQDDNDLLRFEFINDDNGDTKVFAASFDNGVATILGGGSFSIAAGGQFPLYLRVNRTGNNWTISYSLNGSSWLQAFTLSRAMTITAVDIFIANEALSAGNEPPVTAVIDYFFNTASPIIPEDDQILTCSGDRYTLDVNTIGNGNVALNPDQLDYLAGEVVTLTATAAPQWLFNNWHGDISSTANPITITINSDTVVTATFTLAAALAASDDFNSCTLNTGIWEFVNPLADATLTFNGTQAIIAIPAGVGHSVWGSDSIPFADTLPRLRQSVGDTDFDVIVKFESGVSQQFQTQGLLIEQDDNDLIRYEFLFDDTDQTRLFVADFTDGLVDFDDLQIATAGGAGVTPVYLRVIRTGDLWDFRYSFNGTDWLNFHTMTQALTVTAVSVYGGNEPITEDDAPAHTAIIDYFFNAASPIIPEDGQIIDCGAAKTYLPMMFNGAVPPSLNMSSHDQDAMLAWSTPSPNCTYEVHRSQTPYFAPSVASLLAGPFDESEHTDANALKQNRFYTILARACDSSTAVSNPTGAFRFGLHSGE